MAKVIKCGILTRESELDRQAIDEKSRTVELSFSSETPVKRFFGMEILDHSKGAVDLSRLNNGGALLMDHDPSKMIGVVEKARIEDGKGRATVRFSRSPDGQNAFQDVQDGIRKLVSVGYRINKMEKEKMDGDMATMRATNWMPMEISLVSIPADPTVGVGRNVDENQFEIRIDDFMEPTNIPVTPAAPAAPAPAPTPGLQARQAEVPDFLLTEDVKQIRAIVNYYKTNTPGIEELGKVAEISQMGIRDFRARVLDLIQKQNPVTNIPSPLAVKPTEIEKHYSLSRAITAMLPGGAGLSGFERELNQEVTKRYGTQPEGFWVPAEVLATNMQRSFVAGTGTLGGFLIQTDNLGQQFIELLRNRTQVMRLGARTLSLDRPVTIPRQAAAGAANWVGETVASTLSVGNFEQITLSPKGISANQQYAKQLLVTNNPSIDALIRDDILNIIGIAIDLAALHGTGTTQPVGVIGTTGIGSVALATNGQALGNSTAYSAMVSLETLVSAANADLGALAYLARGSHRGSLKVAQRFASTDSPVWTTSPVPGNQEGNGANDGMVNGYRAAVTNQIATNLTTGTATTICSAIFYGNWNELLIGQFNGGATDLIVDPYTAGANAVVRLYARHWIDVGVRHAASFSVLGGIL